MKVLYPSAGPCGSIARILLSGALICSSFWMIGCDFPTGGASHIGPEPIDIPPLSSPSNNVTDIVAGIFDRPAWSDGQGDLARFNFPSGIAVDGAGNIYVADTSNHTIRMISAAGLVTTLAGSRNPGAADGIGIAASFDRPEGVAVDAAGNVTVADSGNNTIRRITSAGVVTTLSAGATAGEPQTLVGPFNRPVGVALGGDGTVYVADKGNHTIRKISIGGQVTTLAGAQGLSGTRDGSDARFNSPSGVAVDSAGNVYVADTGNQTIRMITSAGVTTTIAGKVGISGSVDGAGGDIATFSSPTSVTLAASTPGSNLVLLIGENNSTLAASVSGRIRRVERSAANTVQVTTMATDFSDPRGVAVDADGNIYVGEYMGHIVKRISEVKVRKYDVYLEEFLPGAVFVRRGVPVAPFQLAEVFFNAWRFQRETSYVFEYKFAVPGLIFTNSGIEGPNIIIGTPTTEGIWEVKNGRDVVFYLHVVSDFPLPPGDIRPAAVPGSTAFKAAPNTAAAAGSSNPLFKTAAAPGSLTFSTLAGSPGVVGTADGTGGVARFHSLAGAAVDSAGNLYVADPGNATIRKITSDGAVTTLAGSPGLVGTADGTGSAARFNTPMGIAVDPAGNVYVADSGNATIRKISSSGAVTTLAGSPRFYGSADGIGRAARFAGPVGIALDDAGNIYVTETLNRTIRRINLGGVVTTLAGSPGAADGATNGTGSAASFADPRGIAVDSAGNVIVADYGNGTIRKITSSGVVTTLAGSPGTTGTSDGTAGAARFHKPIGVAVDSTGNAYVADTFNHTIRKITSGGVVTTVAGSPRASGSADGIASVARFNYPVAVAVDSGGSLYIADRGNRTMRKINASGSVTTPAGSPNAAYSADGAGSAVKFYAPTGLAVGLAGSAYVADSSNHTIRRIASSGTVTVLAGSPGMSGVADGTGSAARFNNPKDVTADTAGNVYVADTLNHTVRRISASGVVTTLAGSPGVAGSIDGSGGAARFNYPAGLAMDTAGNVYVADYGNHMIRKITSGGVVTSVAGSPGVAGFINGTSTAARFYDPTDVIVDSAGNIFVADFGNHAIRKITSGGAVTTHAGSGFPGSTDGSGGAAQFASPSSVAVDGVGNVYVADLGNQTIRKISISGAVTTVGGAPGLAGTTDGIGSAARFSDPASIAANSAGYIIVADSATNTIRLGTPEADGSILAPVVTVQPLSQVAVVGSSVTFTVTATGTPAPTYQWRKDGTPIAGATANSLTLAAVSVGNAGSYTVVVTNGTGSATSAAAVLGVNATAGPTSALSNLSVRTTMASGQILIVGAVVNGGAKTILIRAGGPALNVFGLTGMVDPRLELFTTGSLPMATNDDWPATLTTTFSSLGAFSFSPGSKDAALSQALNGAFTVQAKGTGPGTIIVEAYDVAGGVSPRLVNLSARSLVGTGDDLLIAGFNLTGTGTKQVLIRAIGPGLAAFGVPRTLVDPKLQVFNASGTVVAANDNWAAALAPTFSQVGAFLLPPASRDAALLVFLNAGTSYTVQVSGADGGTGEALIEVYEIF